MSRLTPLQEEVVREFFRSATGFFLTGGAALAGYHLGHRTTNHLDLFTTSGGLEAGVSALREAAVRLGASLEALRTAPDFRRFLLSRGDGAVGVDLVRDPTPQLHEEKLERDGGLTAAQLAWVLSQVRIGPDARVPGGIGAGELRVFLDTLVERLPRLAYPG